MEKAIKARFVHIVRTTVGEKDGFEKKINEAIVTLVNKGCTIVSFQFQNFGISPMFKEAYIIYERSVSEGYVSDDIFKKEYELRHPKTEKTTSKKKKGE